MKTSRQAKIRSIAVLITAALLLELTTAVQFMSTRKAISSQIMEMAQRDLSETNHTAEIKRIAEGAIADMIMLYTDGLNEATNAAEELFGFSRIASTINGSDSTQAATKAQKTFTPEELIETMKQSVAHFVQDAEQSDDLTMLAILYKGA